MKCPNCGEDTNVLQTFDYDDHVLRVRGHRDQSKCWWRSKTIERFDTYAPDTLVRGAQATVLELRPMITQMVMQLKDFDLRLKRALNMDTLVNVLDTDRDKINLF
jgi:transcriptional regulator NrdR family protein